MAVQASYITNDRKAPEFNKSLKIYPNGVDNLYPNLVEYNTLNSVTANRCAKLLASYIVGKGVLDNKQFVHKNKKITILKFLRDLGDSFAKHAGVFIHVGYNANGEKDSFEVLPFADCRLGKADDNKYSGKILLCDDWADLKKAKKASEFNVYNSKKEIVLKQIENSGGGINKYKGQIYYFKFDNYMYPYSPLHPCLGDAESEINASKYKKTSLKSGFFGKTIVVTPPLVEVEKKTTDEALYNSQVSQRDEVRGELKKFIGAENADGVLHLEVEADEEGLDKVLMFKNINSNIDDKLFAHTENSVRNNIRMCYNNIPPQLIHSTDGALFGQSGEAINAMKLFYQDQTTVERMAAEQIIQELIDESLTIIPLIDKELTTKPIDDVSN